MRTTIYQKVAVQAVVNMIIDRTGAAIIQPHMVVVVTTKVSIRELP